jgi:hypothetical protein
MKPEKGTSNFNVVALPPEGTYVARCYGVADIGTVPRTFQGTTDGTQKKIIILFELPTLVAKFKKDSNESQPFGVSQEFTLSFGDKANLTKFLFAWRNKRMTAEEAEDFDYFKMINKPCQLQLIHRTKKAYKGTKLDKITNENTSLVISGVMSVPQGLEVPKLHNPIMKWDWDVKFDKEAFLKIPRWIRKRITESEEFKELDVTLEELEKGKEPTKETNGAAADDGNW